MFTATFDWFTTTRDVSIDGGSGNGASVRLCGSVCGVLCGGVGTARGTRGGAVAALVTGAAVVAAAMVDGTALVGEVVDGASIAVTAGAANTPPSRADGVVACPHPAATTINTLRLTTPSPEAVGPARRTMPP